MTFFSLIWFLILDARTGQPYKGARASKVSLASSADVTDLLKTVSEEEAAILSGISSCQIIVYKNKASFDMRNGAIDEGKEEPLKKDAFVNGLGSSLEEALIIIVPSSTSSSGSTTESSITRKQPAYGR